MALAGITACAQAGLITQRSAHRMLEGAVGYGQIFVCDRSGKLREFMLVMMSETVGIDIHEIERYISYRNI